MTHRDEAKAMGITRQVFEVSDLRHCGLDEDMIFSFGEGREVGRQVPLWLLWWLVAPTDATACGYFEDRLDRLLAL